METERPLVYLCKEAYEQIKFCAEGISDEDVQAILFPEDNEKKPLMIS